MLTSKASQASVAAAPLAEQALSSLRETAAAAADAAASAASQASEAAAPWQSRLSSLQESAVRAQQSASVVIRIKALQTEIGILESNIEQWKKEWGLLCFDHFTEGRLAECSNELYRIKQTIYELTDDIAAKQVRIRGYEVYGLAYMSLLASALGTWRERQLQRTAEAQRVHALDQRAEERAPVSTVRRALRHWHRLRVPLAPRQCPAGAELQWGGGGTAEGAPTAIAAAIAIPVADVVRLPVAAAMPEDRLPVVGVAIAPPAAAVKEAL